MKRCPTCNRSYSTDELEVCPEDGSSLVSDTSGELPPTMYASSPPVVNSPPQQQSFQSSPANSTPGGFAAPPSSFAPAQTPPTPFASTEKKRKGLAIIALVIGIVALLATSLLFILHIVFRMGLILWPMMAFVLLSFLGIALGAVGLFLAFRTPAKYGGKLASTVGILTSLLVPVVFLSSTGINIMRSRTPNSTPSSPTVNTAPAPVTSTVYQGSVRNLIRPMGGYTLVGTQNYTGANREELFPGATEVLVSVYRSSSASLTFITANFSSAEAADRALQGSATRFQAQGRRILLSDINSYVPAPHRIGRRLQVYGTSGTVEGENWTLGSVFFAVGPPSPTAAEFARNYPYYYNLPQ